MDRSLIMLQLLETRHDPRTMLVSHAKCIQGHVNW